MDFRTIIVNVLDSGPWDRLSLQLSKCTIS